MNGQMSGQMNGFHSGTHSFSPIADPSTRHPSWSDEEWRVRKELAALYRVVAFYGMTDVIETHISARLSEENHDFLINRYGVMFHEMRAVDLLKVNVDGECIDERLKSEPNSCKLNAAGIVIHTAMHSARHDLKFIVHTHTLAGMAVSAQEHGLLPLTQHAMKFHNCIGYHDFEGLALNNEERARLVRDMGQHKALILRNHGLLVGGGNVAEAFHEIYYLEKACQAQIQALAGGGKLIMPNKEVIELTAKQMNHGVIEGSVNRSFAWEAAKRLVGAD